MPLLLVFHLSEMNGSLQSTMDSPDQGTMGIVMEETVFENGKLKIAAGALNAEFSAELNETADSLTGTFIQNGRSFDLVLIRDILETTPIFRPQEPTDFPYYQEEIQFINSNGGHKLAGTLTIPQDGQFDKTVVLISGSGPQDRNEEVANHKPFLVLSHHFTRQGIAVLRYDDRGVGASEGVFSEATSKDFADDAAAAVDYLKSREDMNTKAIGLVGHSEGGMIAPIVASENADVDFIVLLAGPGINIKELLLLQQERIGEAEGLSESSRKTMASVSKEVFHFIETNSERPKEGLVSELTKILEDRYASFTEEERLLVGNKENFINQQTNIFASEWYLFFLRFNPDVFLCKVECPVLAVNGELDLQVTARENLEGIRESLKKANNQTVTIHEFEGLNHLFQKTTTGAPSEYARLEETFNEDAMKFISKWILDLKI